MLASGAPPGGGGAAAWWAARRAEAAALWVARTPHNRLALLLVWFLVFYYIQGVLASYRTLEERFLTLRYGKSLSEYAESQSVYSAAWFIKPVYGWLSDNVSPLGWGYRRPYAFVGPLIGGLSFAVLPSVQPVGSGWASYLVVVFLRSAGIALADAAVDGLLIDANVGDYGSIVQGVMNSARSVGDLVSTAAAGEIAGVDVSPTAWYFLAASVWVAVPFAFMVREERHVKEAMEWRGLWALASLPVVMVNLFNVLAQVGNRIASLPLTRWAARDFGFTTPEITRMTTAGKVVEISACREGGGGGV